MIQVVRPWKGLIIITESEIQKDDIYFWEAKWEVKKEANVVAWKVNIKEIKDKLKDKWIKFFAWAKDDKILELAKENGII